MIVKIRTPETQIGATVRGQSASTSTSVTGDNEGAIRVAEVSIPSQVIDVMVTGQSTAISTSIAEGGSGRVAYMAKRLETPRRIAISGDVSGSEYFDGSRDIDIETRAILITNYDIEEMMANG